MPQKSNDFRKGRENEHYTLVQMTSYDVRHSSSSCLFANEMKVHCLGNIHSDPIHDEVVLGMLFR